MVCRRTNPFTSLCKVFPGEGVAETSGLRNSKGCAYDHSKFISEIFEEDGAQADRKVSNIVKKLTIKRKGYVQKVLKMCQRQAKYDFDLFLFDTF